LARLRWNVSVEQEHRLMPKSRKRHQKSPARSSQRRQPMAYVPDPSINFSKAPPPDDAGAVPTAEDWQRLHDSFLAEYPVCPDCGAAWDLTPAEEEMGQLGDGTFEISGDQLSDLRSRRGSWT
jgi:hypothetical protein